MAKILKFPIHPPQKFGFERVKKPKQVPQQKRKGQLNLFSHEPARIIEFQSNLSLFEQALFMDERGDEKAAELYAKSIEKGDCVADAYCNLGVLESLSGRSTKAFDCFTNSLKHDPRHFESHYNLANLYLDVGDFGLAELHYGLAAELEPDFPNIYFNLGIVHALRNKLDEAISAFEEYKKRAAPDECDKADELLATLKESVSGVRRHQVSDQSTVNSKH